METFNGTFGEITFDFDADKIKIVFESVSRMALGAPESMTFKISEVTAIEVQPPRFMKAAIVCFIINGIRYKNKLSDRLATTHLLFEKKTFERVERLLSLIVKRNGLDGFHKIDSVDADIREYRG